MSAAPSAAAPSTAIAPLAPPSEKAVEALSGSPYVSPQEWATLSAIAKVVHNTEFVPRGLRGKEPAVLACLLYGRDQGLSPSVSLTTIDVIDGTPTMRAALQLARIRQAGHRIKRVELYDNAGVFTGIRGDAERGDTGESDSFTFTLEDARTADLAKKDVWKKHGKMMCWWRVVSSLAKIMFGDVFLGVSFYDPEELEEMRRDGAPTAEGAAPEGPVLDFGPDPVRASRLHQLFSFANEQWPGSYRPAKQAAMLAACHTDEERDDLIGELEEFCRSRETEPPEPVEDAEIVEEPPPSLSEREVRGQVAEAREETREAEPVESAGSAAVGGAEGQRASNSDAQTAGEAAVEDGVTGQEVGLAAAADEEPLGVPDPEAEALRFGDD